MVDRRVHGGFGAVRRLVRALLAVVMVPVVVLAAPPSSAGATETYVVTTTGDGADTDIGDGDCIATTGGCTLRAAIQEANDDNDHDIIQFALGGPAEIVAGFGLPAITEPLTIDGSTNPGANCDYLGDPATPAVPTVAINGSNLTIRAEADGSVIRNLAIHSATDGIVLRGDSNTASFPFNNSDSVEDVVVECSWIGFRLDGTVGVGQTGTGVGWFERPPVNTRIGGNTGDPGNVIGGYDEFGIELPGAIVFNNRIGVNPNGGAAGNGVGVRFSGQLRSNTIANSTGNGVERPSGEVINNLIRDNGGAGVSAPYLIPPPPGPGPVILRDPVLIRGGRIENNGGLGIEGGFASDPFGPSDGRVTVLSVSGSQLRVRADGGQELDVYFNTECDPSGFGEGQDHRETFVLPTGVDVHTLTMASPLPVGQFVTATVVVNEPVEGSPYVTSQFSNCRGESSQFVVNAQTNGGDANLGNGACADASGFCTLRAALEEANALGAGGVDEIVFDLPAGVLIPVSGSALPPVTVPLTIDGSGNSGAGCGTPFGPPSGLVRVQGAPGVTVGLVFTSTASGSTLRGLQVTRFTGDGVRLLGDDFVVECNIFGSASSAGNTEDGIEISNGDNNIVGGSFPFQGNMMVNNGSAGVRISGFSDFNRVSSNWIGTDGVATAAGNDVGVEVEGSASDNAIGSFLQPDGSTPGGNVIGDNADHGVNVVGSGTRNFVTGNLIGVLEDGTAMGNGRHGVRTEAPGVLIGRGRGAFTQLFDDPNVVGFNQDSGMALFGDDATVIENFIGVSASGADIGNTDYGIFLGGNVGVVRGNTIGFNGRDGVLLNGASNDVEDNLIGVQPDGFSAAGNTESGVDVRGDSNTVGGSDPADGNIIRFNGRAGVSFGGTAELGVVQNNEISVNGGAGIDVSGTATRNLFQENSITGNGGLGVDLGANGQVEPNDDEDQDDGPNDLMNAPVLGQVDPEFGLVEFFYVGEPSAQHVIEFSANLTCDASGTGEGLRPIGSTNFVTNANGDGQGIFSAPGGFVEGEVLTALVSGFSGGSATTTSEFSECLQVPGTNQTDSDGDGIFDVFELDEDTDGDGLVNRFDADDDGDGRPTNVENVDVFNSGSGNTANALNSDDLGPVDYLDPAALFRLLEPACRVLQTGEVKGEESIDFSVNGGTPLSTFNSGPDDCVVPDDATGVLANVIIVDPVAEGNLRLTAAGTTPSGGVVNFSASELNNSNALSVPLSASGELNVSVNLGGGSTAVAAGGIEIEILGYYQVAETPSLVFNTVTPCTVFDTRTNQGGSGPIAADALIGVDVVGSFPGSQGGGNTNCQVPDGAEAVLVNVVALNTTGIVDITDALGGATVVSNQEHSSTMNNSSAVVLPVNASGQIALDVDVAGGSSNVRVVVLGHYFPSMVGPDAAAGLEFRPVVPCAAFDTRGNQGSSGGFTGQRTNGQTTAYDVAGAFDPAQGGGNTGCGVPASAVAVEMNLVAINASREGNLRVAAAGVTPSGGVLNFANLTPKMNNSNALVVELSNAGAIEVTVNGGGAAAGLPITDIRGIITGYYVFQADQS